MSTPNHTPGPWAVAPRQWDHGASLAIVAPNNGYVVAIVPFDEDIQVVDEPDGDTVRRHPDDVPNAALLAAAPAMYEACKAARGNMTGTIGSPSMGRCLRLLREAINQAEGNVRKEAKS